MNRNWTAILTELKELWKSYRSLSSAFSGFFDAFTEDSSYCVCKSPLDGYMRALEIIFDENTYLNIEYFVYEVPSLGDNAIVTDRYGEKYNFNKLEEAVKFFEKWYPL